VPFLIKDKGGRYVTQGYHEHPHLSGSKAKSKSVYEEGTPSIVLREEMKILKGTDAAILKHTKGHAGALME